MKKKHELKERVLSFMLAFALVAGMVLEPLPVRAAQPDEGQQVQKSTENGAGQDANEGIMTTVLLEAGAVTITSDVSEIYVGETVQLSAEVTPESEEALVWDSKNPDIATVNEAGLVTAVSAGTATITATVGADVGEATITVLAKRKVSGSVASNQKQGKMLADVSVSIDNGTTTVATDENGAFSFEDVIQGKHLLKFTKPGFQEKEVEINVKDEDCIVGTGGPVLMDINSFTIDGNTTICTDETAVFTPSLKESEIAEIYGDSASVNWTSQDANVAAIDAGTVTGMKSGTVNIFATLTTEYGDVQSNSISLTVEKRNTTLVLSVQPGEENNKNINEVTLKAEVNTAEVNGQAGKPVSSGDVEFTITQTNVLEGDTPEDEKTKTVSVVDGTAFLTVEREYFAFSGSYDFKAEYLGDEGKYNSSLSDTKSLGYEAKPMEFKVFDEENPEGNKIETTQESPEKFTYGEKFSVFVNEEQGVEVEAVVQKEIEVKADASVKIEKKATSSQKGYIEFEITANTVTGNIVPILFTMTAVTTTGDTEHLCTNFYVQADKRMLTVAVERSQIKYEKIYDDNLKVLHNSNTGDTVDLSGIVITSDEIVGDDEVNVDAAQVEMFKGTIVTDNSEILNANENPYEKNKISFQAKEALVLTGAEAKNYELSSDEIQVNASITVNPRPVDITVKNASREYGHALGNDIDNKATYTFFGVDGEEITAEEWISIEKQTDYTDYENDESLLTKYETQGILPSDEFTIAYADALLEEQGVTNTTAPNEVAITNVLSADTGKFCDGNETKQKNYDFTITQGALTIEKEKITDVTNYLQLKSDTETTQTMYIKTTDDGPQVWVRAKDGELKLYADIDKLYDKVCLLDKENEIVSNLTDTAYNITNENDTSIELKLCLKNSTNGALSEPFDFTIYLDKSAPTVSFDDFNGKQTKLETFLDKISFGTFGKTTFKARITVDKEEETSGCKEWYYAVLPIENSDVSSQKALKVYMNEQVQLGKLEWNKNEEKKFTEEIEIAKCAQTDVNAADFIANNYIVLVKTFDNVNNSKIYASNGLVLDNTDPIVKVELAPKQKYEEIYSDDVKLQVSVLDAKSHKEVADQKEILGIEEIYYETLVGGEVKGEPKAIYKGKESYTLKELQEEIKPFTKDFYGNDIKASKNLNSNDIVVRATAVDHSGNKITAEMPLKIDVTKPTVNVSYSTAATEDFKPYYNKERTATITVKERNVNVKNKNELYFDLKRENEKNSAQYSLSELNNLAGIEAKVIKDTEGDVKDASKYTDERTTTIEVKFTADNQYDFNVRCVDKVGHANKEDNEEYFVIDRTSPKMKVSYYTADEAVLPVSQQEGERVYRNKDISAKVEILEHNFANQKVPVDVQVKADKTVEGQTMQAYHGEQMNTEKWAKNGDMHSSVYTFNADANYTHSIVYTDLAGNQAIYNPGYFTVDKTEPTGNVAINGFGFWDRLWEEISFGLFSPSSVTAEVRGGDHTSPIYPVQYMRSHDMLTRDALEANNNWNSVPADSPDYAGFTVDRDEQFILYTKVTDYAGNYQYFSSNGMIVDTAKPAPVVNITNLSQAQNGIFNENVMLQIDVEDPTAGDTYSGLERVWYKVSASGNVTAGETIELMNNSGKRVQSNKTFSQVITVPANVYNSNDVKVQAFAQDFSGNEGESTVTELKIDTTNPTISVSWDLNNPLNNKYYKDTRTATVTVTDRNFDPNNVKFNITNTDGTSASIGNWSSSGGINVSDSATSTCQVSFPSDGDYTFTLGCTDLAGNSVEYGQTDEFTIDKTVPVVTVSYDNNDARNGSFYKEARTATVTVREHNFNAAEVHAAITASLQGSGASAPSIGGFSSSGDVHTANISYAADGDYTFDIDYTDMAGNPAVDYTQESFTVDLKAPEIEIVDVEDKSANNDVVSPAVKATDINYDAQNVTVTITGTNNGPVDVGKVISAIENGQSIKVNDFSRDEKMDDLYKLSAKAVDKAGNETEKSILFSVNRYGSVYVLDAATSDWLNASGEAYTYINQEQEIGIIEYNVDEIETSKITVNRDGELRELKENADYTVKNSGSEVQWKEKHYTVNADNFAEEGNYTVILNTQDKAKNAVNNTSVKKKKGKLPIEFTVDKTAPTVVVSGVEDGGRYTTAEKNLTVDAKDNLVLAEVTLSVNGKDTVYTAEDLKGNDGIVEMSLASANDWQNIQINAKDMAGNVLGQTKESKEAKPLTLRVLVTSNIMIQYYMNKPLFFGSIAGGAAVLGGAVYLILIRRKRLNSRVPSILHSDIKPGENYWKCR